jgi:hypothetical protein
LSVSAVYEVTQKFPDWVHNELNNNKHSLRSKQRVMAAKLTTLTQKIAIQIHLVEESCTICSSRSRRPVLKLLNTPSYICTSFFSFKIYTHQACQSGLPATDIWVTAWFYVHVYIYIYIYSTVRQRKIQWAIVYPTRYSTGSNLMKAKSSRAA